MIKIIYLHQYFNTPAMYGGTRSFEMARRLVDSGHEVHMVTSSRASNHDGGGRRWRQSQEAGINVHWLPVPYSNKMHYQQRMRAFFAYAYGAARKAAALSGDVVFATSTPLTIALPAVYAARINRIPMVFEVRDLWPELPIAIGALRNPLMIEAAKRLERFAYRNASQIVALSPGMRDGIVATGYPEDWVHLIPNSADLELFGAPEQVGHAFRQEHTWLGNRPLVVYTGTVGRINGVSYLVHVAAKVKELAPEVRFLVVGEGQEEAKVHHEAEALGVLNETFFMLPQMPKQEMPKVLSAATLATSLFVDIKEMWANSANKFFDALASGTPVAINYGGWQAELLHKHGAGLRLHATDVERAASELLAFLRSGEVALSQAGQQARRLAETQFSRDVLARDLEKVLVKAVEEQASRNAK